MRDAPGTIEDLFARYSRRIYASCLWTLRGDTAAAEDATAETFVSAWHGLPGLRDPAAVEGWLLRIAHRAAQRQMRPDWVTVLPEMPEAAGVSGPDAIDAVVNQSYAWRILHAAAPALEKDNRRLLGLLLQDGAGGRAELAAAYGKSEAATVQAVKRLTDPGGLLYQAVVTVHLIRTGGDGCAAMAQLIERAGGRPTPALRKRVAAHVAACRVCEGAQRRTPVALAVLTAFPIVLPPTAVRKRVLRAISAGDRMPAAGRMWRRAVVAGAAAGVAFAGLLLLTDRSGGPAAVAVAPQPSVEPSPSAFPSAPSPSPHSVSPSPSPRPSSSASRSRTPSPSAGSSSVAEAKPDFALRLTAELTEGVLIIVDNLGQAESPPTTVIVRAGTQAPQTQAVPAIPAGLFTQLTVGFAQVCDPVESCSVSVTVDPDDTVAEVDERNNVKRL